MTISIQNPWLARYGGGTLRCFSSLFEVDYWQLAFAMAGMLLLLCSTLWMQDNIFIFVALCVLGISTIVYGLFGLRSRMLQTPKDGSIRSLQQFELHYDDLALPLLRYIFDVNRQEEHALHGIRNSSDVMVRIRVSNAQQHVVIQLFDSSGDMPIALSSPFCYEGAEARRILHLLE